MESIIEKIVLDAFGEEDFEVVKRLIGGRSNYTYVVIVNDEKYTVRVPGKNGNLFVDREYENKNLSAVNKIGINNETVYLNIQTGVKISRYIEGETLFSKEYSDYYSKIAEVLHKVHQLPKFTNDYNPLGRLAMYESFCSDLGFDHPEEYFKRQELFLSVYDELTEDQVVACHNDAQPSNFIVGDDRCIYLTDWEFAGNNYALYDIACFADNNIEQSVELLKAYKNGNATNSDIRKVCLWRMFQTLQWYNVATYKELIGLSEELLVDFKQVAENYLEESQRLFNLAEEYSENK